MYEDLAVWRCEPCREHFQKHPVIDLSFKNIKPGAAAELFGDVSKELAREYKKHRYLLDSLLPEDQKLFRRILELENDKTLLKTAISDLAGWLEQHHGAKPVILLDEYDVPIQAAWNQGFYDEAITFFRDFMAATFKDNEHLYRGVLTGVLRVSKESMFSGANNIKVHSIFRDPYATSFGFTQEEVDAITDQLDVADAAETVRTWYNGYRFAGHVIYNPWSVLNYAAAPEIPEAHWVFTGADDVLRRLVLGRWGEVRPRQSQGSSIAELNTT